MGHVQNSELLNYQRVPKISHYCYILFPENMGRYPKIWLLYLLGGIATPLKNMSSSVGMMTFPTEWKVIKFHGSKPPTSY